MACAGSAQEGRTGANGSGNAERLPRLLDPRMKVVTRGLRFPEGPVALAGGSVLVVEIARGTLTRVHPDGRQSIVAQLGGGPNGAAIGSDGACYICNNGGFSWIPTRTTVMPGLR